MDALRPLTGEELARVIERLRNPKPGGKRKAARQLGVDVTLLIEQVSLSPADRASRMHDLALVAQAVRGSATSVVSGQKPAHER